MDRLRKFGRRSMRVINRITKREEESADYNFTSSVNEDTRTVSWTIENISKSDLELGQRYESPPFCTGFSRELEWTLRLYPKGRKVSEKVGIFIHSISEPLRSDISLKYTLQVELIACDNSAVKIYTHTGHTNKNHDEIDEKRTKSREFGTDEFIPCRSLKGIKALAMRCQLTVYFLDKEKGSDIVGLPVSSTLYGDLKEMYKSGKYSDVTLEVGQKKFPVHKAVLSARSKVFSAMFNHNMKEKQTDEIPIEDVEPSVMNSVLLYMYTGKLGAMTMDEAAGVFFVADKYSLEELQKYCVDVMLAKMSVDNVCQVAILADMHSVPELKTATNFVFRKYMHDIVGKKEWKKIITEKPQLASDILKNISSGLPKLNLSDS